MLDSEYKKIEKCFTLKVTQGKFDKRKLQIHHFLKGNKKRFLKYYSLARQLMITSFLFLFVLRRSAEL